MRSKKDIRYQRKTKAIEKWCKRMQATLDAIPKDTHLEADGSLHLFSKYKDGSMFKACERSEDSTEANDCKLHSFDAYCDGGDFW